MLNLLAQFFYLQLLDLLTTLAFLAVGIREANPVVRLLVAGAGSPLAGLLAAKLVAFALAGYCWHQKRQQLLVRANVFYALLVAWNLVAFLASTTASLPA